MALLRDEVGITIHEDRLDARGDEGRSDDVVVAEDDAAADLRLVVEVVENVPDFLKVMVTPMVAVETKTAILDSVLEVVRGLARDELGGAVEQREQLRDEKVVGIFPDRAAFVSDCRDMTPAAFALAGVITFIFATYGPPASSSGFVTSPAVPGSRWRTTRSVGRRSWIRSMHCARSG